MKKAVKLLSGLTLVVALSFIGFSSFTPPEVVTEDPCDDCPPGWQLVELKATNNNTMQFDANGDGWLCWKPLPEQSKGIGNNKGGMRGKEGYLRNYKDNNKCVK